MRGGIGRGGAQSGGHDLALPGIKVHDGGGPGAVRHGPQANPASGERAGLVETKHVHPAESLDGPRVSYQCPAAGQPPGGGKLGRSGEERQALRHGGNSQRHARAQRVSNGPATDESGREQRPGRADHHRHGELGDRGEPRFDPDGPGRTRRHGHAPARLGGRTRRHDHSSAVTGGHRGPLVHHGRPGGHVTGCDRTWGLRNGKGFTGQRGLVNLKICRCQQASVGGNDVPWPDRDHVAGNDLLCGDVDIPAVATHPCADRGLGEQAGKSGVGPPLLDRTHERGHDRDTDHQSRIQHRSGGSRQGRPTEENRRQRVGELPDEGSDQIRRDRAHAGHLRAPRQRVSAREPIGGAAQLLQDTSRRQDVPWRTGAGRRLRTPSEITCNPDPVAERQRGRPVHHQRRAGHQVGADAGHRYQRTRAGPDLGEPHRLPAHRGGGGDSLHHHRRGREIPADQDVRTPGRGAVVVVDPDTEVGAGHRGTPVRDNKNTAALRL